MVPGTQTKLPSPRHHPRPAPRPGNAVKALISNESPYPLNIQAPQGQLIIDPWTVYMLPIVGSPADLYVTPQPAVDPSTVSQVYTP